MDLHYGWTGKLEIGDRWAIWRGAVGDSQPHRHYAAQAVLSTEAATVAFADGELGSGTCLLIAPLLPHRLLPHAQAAILFVEPGAAVVTGLDPAWLAQIRIAIARSATPPSPFWQHWVMQAEQPAAPQPDWVEQARKLIDQALGEGNVSLPAIARHFPWSPERFRHRLALALGTPFRRFVLWRRLRLAATLLAQGCDATQAAHGAGFADAAHFARTLKRQFGVTASQALLQPPR
ncbi:helix-turn-helix domain-containing protein [Pseudoduganella sp. FT93W]|uniref:Helix-turn-helix domain-containing protein n=1 Tax=Duganella fentianensis TaxID=2692177 RepID=A0A845I0M5_9BURK|nr:helix-turn-helix transcriptional regulator [Duganella fentianensis]MYN45617.1 helix-turn-helix domain-containing protein [Duganella fentianensis]